MTCSSKLYNLGQIQCPILHISDMPIRSNSQSYSTFPGDRYHEPFRLSNYNTESLTVDQWVECLESVPCSLHSKDLHYRFPQKVGTLQPLRKAYLFHSNPNCYCFFNGNQKSLTRLISPFPERVICAQSQESITPFVVIQNNNMSVD